MKYRVVTFEEYAVAKAEALSIEANDPRTAAESVLRKKSKMDYAIVLTATTCRVFARKEPPRIQYTIEEITGEL